MWLVGGGSAPRVVAGTDGHFCTNPTAVCGDGGPAGAALLGRQLALAVAPDGALYIADARLYRVRRVDPVSEEITTVAGTGEWCGAPFDALHLSVSGQNLT